MSSMRHVAIDLRMYKMSGIGRYLQNLLPALIPRLSASRIYVLGKSSDLADEAWLRDPRIHFREFSARIFSVAEQWAVVAGQYRDLDLLWIPQYNLPLLYRGKFLVTIHDLCQLAHPEVLANDLQRSYAKYLFSKVAKRASAVLCVSEFTASEMERYLRIDRKRVAVAYPPIEETWNFSTAPLIKPSGSQYLLAVGNFKRNKNSA
jgi:glycosyltransferase involved in cell wall biosynthesis